MGNPNRLTCLESHSCPPLRRPTHGHVSSCTARPRCRWSVPSRSAGRRQCCTPAIGWGTSRAAMIASDQASGVGSCMSSPSAFRLAVRVSASAGVVASEDPRSHRVPGDSQHPVLLTLPANGEADDVARDGAAQRRSMPGRVAVTATAGWVPELSPMVVVSQGVRPMASPPSREAAAMVVRTMPADGSSARPALSRGVAVMVVAEQHGVDREQVRG
jgi:hypothetical protein